MTPSFSRMFVRLACAALVAILVVIVVLVVPRRAEMVGVQAQLAQPEGLAVERLRAKIGMGRDNEVAEIEARGDRLERLLTYPQNTFPSDWQGAARKHIQRNVREGVAPTDTASAPSLTIPVTTMQWQQVGPAPIDSTTTDPNFAFQYGINTGRVNALAIHPSTPTIAFAGATAGGLWKTTTCCSADTRWTPLWEDKDFSSQSVSAIEFHPTDPNIMYVGTGDFPARDQFGVGVMKTLDGGATWTLLGGGPNGIFTPFNTQAHGAIGTAFERPPNENIGSIRIDPNNTDTVFVGTQWGLFMSRDAGTNWLQVDVVDATQIQRVSSIVLEDTGTTTSIYVALGYPYTTARFPGINGKNNGVYKAQVPASGAPTFSLSSTSANGWPANTGNCVEPTPTTDPRTCEVGRIVLAQSKQNAQLIYAQVSNYDIRVTNALGTWVTTNGGTTWTKLTNSTDSNYRDCNGSTNDEQQDWYDLFLGVDPTNDKTLYVGRTSLYKATVNSGYTGFSTITDIGTVYATDCSSYGSIHPDQHAIAMRADGSFLVGNDGGIYLGAANAGPGQFTVLNKDLNITQFYAGQLGANWGTTGAPADLGKQYAFGGSQDNGNESWTSNNADLQWQARGLGGDGFFVAFDPLRGSVTQGNWYTEYTYGQLACSTSGAAGPFPVNPATFIAACQPSYTAADNRAGFSTPFTLDQLHCTNLTCQHLILGTQRVWATGNGGLTAASWSPISGDLTKGAATRGTLTDVRFAPSTPATALVGSDDGNVQWSNNIYTGANCTQAANGTATFLCNRNTSATWVNLTQGNVVLPNRAILGVGFDPTNDQVVYAAVGGFAINTPGTPGHVYRAACTTACTTAANWAWQDKSGNLPDVPASSIIANPNNPNQVFVGTHFGFYYTNDITAATPNWVRFQSGLPNTVIQYLTIDRGATTLGAFTFGRGLYVLQLSTPDQTTPTATATTAPTNTATATQTIAVNTATATAGASITATATAATGVSITATATTGVSITATATPTTSSSNTATATQMIGTTTTATATNIATATGTTTIGATSTSVTTSTAVAPNAKLYLPFVSR